VGEWSDVDNDRHYDSWEDYDDADTEHYWDVEPDSPAVVTVDSENAAMSREPARNVVLPIIAVVANVSSAQNVVQSVPIVISDDSVDTNYVGNC